MIICPHCATTYLVETDTLGSAGRTVRCVRCKTVWFATAERPPSAEHVEAEKLSTELVSAAEGLAGPFDAGPLARAEAFEIVEHPMPAADEQPRVAQSIPEEFHQLEPDNSQSGRELETDQASEHIVSSPSIVPPIEQLAALPTALPEPNAQDDGESFVARRERLHQRRKQQSLRMPSAPVAILILTAILAGLVAGRKTIVQYAPQTASLYARLGLPVNFRGLVFDDVKTSRDTHDGIPVLVVEGIVASKSNTPVDVPRLRFAMRNAAGVEVYAWTAVPSRNVLAPGEQIAFKSRLASPPAEGQDVTVRFLTKHDIVAGVR